MKSVNEKQGLLTFVDRFVDRGKAFIYGLLPYFYLSKQRIWVKQTYWKNRA